MIFCVVFVSINLVVIFSSIDMRIILVQSTKHVVRALAADGMIVNHAYGLMVNVRYRQIH